MKPQRISELISRHILGTASEEEELELQKRLENDTETRDFFKIISDPGNLEYWYNIKRSISHERPLSDMQRRIKAVKVHARRKYYAAAAAVILLLGFAGISFLKTESSFNRSGSSSGITAEVSPQEIRHGEVKATFTTPGGMKIALKDTTGGINAGIALVKTSSKEKAASKNIEELNMVVPRGGEFKIVLEDSTIVWLNSESTLRYPENFTATERRVHVSGEAYFEVRKDSSRPFYVESDGQEIRVYGTTFNVRSYSDEEASFTTLQTGSIALTTGRGATAEVFLKPGKQAILDRGDSEVKMRDVDSELVTSWRHGYFVFEDQTLLNIMRDLSRWYDFKFEIADKELEDDIFMGSFPRDTEFKDAIHILEKSGGIKFNVIDGKVIVTKK